jgi:hypothetical protein
LAATDVKGGAQAGEASSDWFFDNLVVGNWHLELSDALSHIALWLGCGGESFGSLN